MTVARPTRTVRFGIVLGLLLFAAAVTGLFSQRPGETSAVGEPPAWVNALENGSAGGPNSLRETGRTPVAIF